MGLLFLLACLWSSAAAAVGLGDLRTQSVQGERLLAEIELRAPEYPGLHGVEAKLAPPRAFERAGVARPTLLDGMRFEPVVLPGGETLIRVTSQAPVRQPELRFLVELTWPNGRMVREYLAVPAAGPAQPAVVMPAVTSERKPEPPRKQAAQAASAAGASVKPPAGGWRYGPVERNDTLWGIASRMEGRSEPVPVIVQRLFEHNPEAFIRGDINRLKVGYELRLPAEHYLVDVVPEGERPSGAETIPASDAELGAAATALSSEAKPNPDLDAASEFEPSSTPQQADTTGHRLALFAGPQPTQVGGRSSTGSAALEQQLLLAQEEKLVAQQHAEQLRLQLEAMAVRLAEAEQLLAMARENEALAAQRQERKHAADLEALAVMDAQYRQSERIARNERVLFGALVGLGLVIVVMGIIVGTLYRRPARPVPKTAAEGR